MSPPETTTSSKFVASRKVVYSLTIESLSELVAYSPGAEDPDSLISKINVPAGAYFTSIRAATAVHEKKWSTIQVSRKKHMELNSALMYLNHSCAPSLEIDTDLMEVRVSKNRDLKIGDELSFFYPSTEFEMDQPFECLCGAGDACLQSVTGAAQMELDVLRKWFVNEHIIKLKQEQNESRKEY